MEPVAESSHRYTFDRVVRMTLSAVTVVAVIALLRYLSDVLIPFAAAVVLAYLLNPVVGLIERRVRNRGVAVGLTLGGLGVAGLAVVALLVPLVLSQVERFYHDVEKLRHEFEFSTPEEPVLAPDHERAPTAKTATGWRELADGWAEYPPTPGRFLGPSGCGG